MPADGAGKLALVTGASAGLGAAFARAYAARGFDVALAARRADRLEALAIELRSRHGVDAFAVVADLSQWEAHVPLMAAIAGRGRPVDVLVNNAGFGIARDFTAVPWARQRDFLMTLTTVANAMRVGDHLIERLGARAAATA